ncbi:ATP-binding cassette domain-containing protein, partial [Alloalcanivorax gelatiniphagus]
MTEALVTVDHAALTLGGQAVLEDVSLTLAPGRITTLIGPNGAGKSTLARLVLGLTRPDRGRVVRRPGLTLGYMPQHLRVDGSLPLTVDRFLWLAAPG